MSQSDRQQRRPGEEHFDKMTPFSPINDRALVPFGYLILSASCKSLVARFALTHGVAP